MNLDATKIKLYVILKKKKLFGLKFFEQTFFELRSFGQRLTPLEEHIKGHNIKSTKQCDIILLMDFDIKVIYSCPPAAAGETAAAKPSAEMAYAAAAEAEKK